MQSDVPGHKQDFPSRRGVMDRSVMEGQGYYNQHSRPQSGIVEFALPALRRAAESCPLDEDARDVVIADLGCSQGRNSIEPIAQAIEILRARSSSKRPISVVHSDLPSNDFNSLIQLIEQDGSSYQRRFEHVFSYFQGRSFYGRLFPDSRVSLAWSSAAVHWFSLLPAPIPDHIWAPRAAPALKAAYASQAAQDWLTFLRHRSQEIRIGGQLLIIAASVDDAGIAGGDGLADQANDVLTSLVADGALDAAEYADMTIAAYSRTLDEYLAPLVKHDPDIRFAVEETAPQLLICPFDAEYEEHGDIKRFAADYAEFFWATYGPSLFTSLRRPRAPEEELELGAELRRRLAAQVATAPDLAACQWRMMLLRLVRNSD